MKKDFSIHRKLLNEKNNIAHLSLTSALFSWEIDIFKYNIEVKNCIKAELHLFRVVGRDRGGWK